MLDVFKFECRYQLRSPLFLVLSVAFFLFAFMLMGSESVTLGGVSRSLNLNAAWTIVYTQFFFSIIGMFGAVAIVSQAITRDYEFNTAEIFFTTGVSPRGFLLGRFFGGFVFAVGVCVAAMLGTLLASLAPWLDPERVGAFSIAPYLYALAVVTVPNIFFSSALFFTLAALTRSMLAAFIGAVAFIVLNIIIGNLVDPEQVDLLAMIDPFGQSAFSDVSRYWTVFERNIELVPVSGNLLINRVAWMSLGVLALLFTIWRYRFSLDPSVLRRKSKRARKTTPKPALTARSVEQVFNAVTPWRQLFSQVSIDLSGIYRSVPFYAILGFALLNVWGGFEGVGRFVGTPLLPVTSGLLRAIGGSYTFFILLIVIYYAGEIVHRERQAKVAEVLDATPFPNVVMVASKVFTLWFMVACLLLLAMVAGIIYQAVQGYTHFEIPLYLQSLLFVQGGSFFMLCVLAVFIQVLAGNKYIGMVAMLAVFFVLQVLPSLDFQHGLYLFSTPPVPHSDMNGFGHFWQPLIAFTAYWSAFCLVLAILAHLLFQRGVTDRLKQRIALVPVRFTSLTGLMLTFAVVAFAGIGSWIFYNTNVLNTYITTDELEVQQAEYEKTYKVRELDLRPEMLSVDSTVDLYPDERRLESKGTAELVNTHDVEISEVMVSTHPFITVNTLAISGAQRVEHREISGTHIFRFDQPLVPGGGAEMSWDMTWDHEGFANVNELAVSGGSSTRVVANGTFVNNSEIMPSLGYNRGAEIGDPATRREYDLPPIQRLPELGDPQTLNLSQFTVARRTEFRTRFSTSADQIAVAPGYLVGDVIERDGRRIYTYEMDAPIWPFFSFLSARYEVASDAHNGIAIEVYHHPAHTFNIEPMIRGTKKALDYFSREFSPYQYRQFRILEFPRYASFAQAFPNTIPFSEAIGFVADLTDPHALDPVFYVTAHELAHQWWAHQVVGAAQQGMTVIVETLAQYSALMVMEQEYGEDKMRRFLRYELDSYLNARGGELIEELPLVRVENQPYIHYRKGSLVMYALQDVIGEDQVNLALRRFIEKYAYVNGPFPTAADLVAEFRRVAGPEHQALITDLFEKITLYDFSVADADVEKIDDEWQISFSVDASKFYADGAGEETDAPLNLTVDVAVFPKPQDTLEDYQLPAPLVFERQTLVSGENQLVLRVNELPHRVGVDPYNKLIDRNPENNLRLLDLP
ncbi:MAG: ABC transporter permease subunit [Pseudomonadaceae bacterium]|nr:ABC transporter permease subunit [Pseudomonadaceae bacterium]